MLVSPYKLSQTITARHNNCDKPVTSDDNVTEKKSLNKMVGMTDFACATEKFLHRYEQQKLKQF